MSSSRKSSKATSYSAKQFSSREQKVIVRYLFYKEIDSSEIHKLLAAACGKDAPSYKEVRSWLQDIEEGREEIDNCVCSGGRKISGLQADAATDPALIARLETLLSNDIRINLNKLAELSVSTPQKIQVVTSTLLGLKRVMERWVPRTWTPEQREYRMKVCRELLGMYEEEGENFLRRIVVGDASFVLYHNSSTNGTTPPAPPPQGVQNCPGAKYKPSNDPERVYCAFFYDMSGMLAAEMLPYSNPLTSEEYVQVLKEVLMPAYKRKRGTPTKPMYLLHNITPEHSAVKTQEGLKELQIIQLPNAVASPDLEPMEFWFYRHMKGILDELHFNSRTDLWSAVQRHMHSITDAEYSKSISRLPDRWSICIEKQGLYLL